MLSPTPGQKCVKWCDVKPGTSRPDDILKQITPTLTPHYFRHNYVGTVKSYAQNRFADSG